MVVLLVRLADFAFDPPQLGIVESEIMPYFMDDRRPDFFPDLVLGGGIPLERLLEDEDDVGGIIAVIGAALAERDAVIEAEELPGRAKPHVGDDFGGGEVFDQDGHVLDPLAEILGQAVDRFGDQLLESLPGYLDHGPDLFLS